MKFLRPLRMNEWMMFLLTCDKKLTKSQLSPTHASTKRKITDELKHNAGWYEVLSRLRRFNDHWHWLIVALFYPVTATYLSVMHDTFFCKKKSASLCELYLKYFRRRHVKQWANCMTLYLTTEWVRNVLRVVCNVISDSFKVVSRSYEHVRSSTTSNNNHAWDRSTVTLSTK